MSAKVRLSPFFLPAESRALFAMYYPAQNGLQPKGYILHVPAFAEEMNKSRRMVALQAQYFANKNYAVLVLDLFGTGDSTGDFSEATWGIWKQDLAAGCHWLAEQGAKSITLWGHRTGTLLAMDFTVNAPVNINHMLCWQPVLNGELFVMQFLRLRIAAAMMDKNAPQEKTTDLKQQLLNGQMIEVAGYLLNPELINPLLALSADRMAINSDLHFSIIEIVASADKPATANTMKFIDALQRRLVSVNLSTIAGIPFWSTQEIAEVPELLAASVNCLP